MAAPVRCRCRPPPRTEVSPAVAEQPKRCQKQVSRTLPSASSFLTSRTRRVRTFLTGIEGNDRLLNKTKAALAYMMHARAAVCAAAV